MKKINPKILIIDKTPELTDVLSGFFKKEGYKVTTANNGTDGLKKFKAKKFDIVLTGVIMPDIDGFEVCKTIKDINKNIPVVIMTVFKEMNMSEAASVGANDIVQKPFRNPNEIISAVKKSLNKKPFPVILEKMIKEDIREYIDDNLYLFHTDNKHTIQLHLKPRLVAEAVQNACVECRKKGFLKKERCTTKNCLSDLFAMSMNYGTQYVNLKDDGKKHRKSRESAGKMLANLTVGKIKK